MKVVQKSAMEKGEGGEQELMYKMLATAKEVIFGWRYRYRKQNTDSVGTVVGSKLRDPSRLRDLGLLPNTPLSLSPPEDICDGWGAKEQRSNRYSPLAAGEFHAEMSEIAHAYS